MDCLGRALDKWLLFTQSRDHESFHQYKTRVPVVVLVLFLIWFCLLMECFRGGINFLLLLSALCCPRDYSFCVLFPLPWIRARSVTTAIALSFSDSLTLICLILGLNTAQRPHSLCWLITSSRPQITICPQQSFQIGQLYLLQHIDHMAFPFSSDRSCRAMPSPDSLTPGTSTGDPCPP